MRWSRSFADLGAARLGPRRRAATRYTLQRHARARAASWPQPLVVELGDVSTGGFGFVTPQPVALGERVEVELMLPNGMGFVVAGSAVSVTAGVPGIAPELYVIGVRLEQLDLSTIALYQQLLTEAQAGAAAPAEALQMDHAKMSAALRVARETSAHAHGLGPSSPNALQAVGIDLGNRHASIAVVKGGVVNVVSRLDGVRSIPTVVAFPEPGGPAVTGLRARPYLDSDPTHCVEFPKRLLGRRWGDPALVEDLERVPWTPLKTRDGGVAIDMHGTAISAARLASGVLAELKAIAEEALGEPVRHAVLTVPVTWEDDAIAAVRRAAELAGLEVLGIVDEPTAAALASSLTPGFGGRVGIADFGAVDFDFSVLDVSRGDYQVLANAGESRLGGDDVDHKMAERIADQFYQANKVDLRTMPVEWRRLVEACERAKRELVQKDVATVSVKEILRTPRGTMDLFTSFDRPALISILAPYVDQALRVITETLEGLQMDPSQLTAVYLTGGMSYMPITWQSLEVTLRVPILCGAPPELAACLGAGLYAARL